MHELKGNAPALFEVSETKDGKSYRQSGLWDREILCAEHEAALAQSDDYVVRFWRRYKLYAASAGIETIQIDNPRPDLLTKFIYSVLWRWSASKVGRAARGRLGPFLPILEQAVFNNGPQSLPTMVFESDIRFQSEPADLVVAPFKTNIKERNGWVFKIGRLDFFTFCDRRGVPAIFNTYIANDAFVLNVFKTKPLDVTEAAGFRRLLRKIAN